MKVLVVYKKSAWELFSSSQDPHVEAFMRERGRDTKAFASSHETQGRAREAVESAISKSGAQVEMLYRSDLTPERFENIDLAVTVGGDGTFLETSHYLSSETPILGVNSDPSRSVGFFSACSGPEFLALFERLDEIPRAEVTRAEVVIDGQVTGPPVLNDVLFASPNPAATTRYRLGDLRYRNSGLLACTAAGSTAWMFQEGGVPMQLDDTRLQILHRGTRGSPPEFTEQLALISLTRRGELFIDGEHLAFPLSIGQTLELRGGPPLLVIGDLARKRKEFMSRYAN